MLATRRVADLFDELETVLGLLVPALERLHDGQVRQREVIVQGELRPLLVVTAELDDAGTRVAGFEGRRRAIQEALEAELGATGLRALAEHADPARRARLLVLLDQLGTVVPRLQEDGRRNAALLDSAADLARRTRVTLERLSGADSLYDPIKARRKLAAQRAVARPASAPDSPATPSAATSLAATSSAATQSRSAPMDGTPAHATRPPTTTPDATAPATTEAP